MKMNAQENVTTKIDFASQNERSSADSLSGKGVHKYRKFSNKGAGRGGKTSYVPGHVRCQTRFGRKDGQ